MPFDGFCFNCKFKLTFHSDFKFNFYQGFVKAIIGPSLLDLQEIVNADENAVFHIHIMFSWLFKWINFSWIKLQLVQQSNPHHIIASHSRSIFHCSTMEHWNYWFVNLHIFHEFCKWRN